MNTFQTLTNHVTSKRLISALLASLFVMPLTLTARDPGLNQPGAVGGVSAPAAAAVATPAGVGRVGGVGAPAAAAVATPAGVGHVGGVGAPAAAAVATPAGVGHVGGSARQVRVGVR